MYGCDGCTGDYGRKRIQKAVYGLEISDFYLGHENREYANAVRHDIKPHPDIFRKNLL